jgi:ABC-type ATPase with predicted acetyltransferase domain
MTKTEQNDLKMTREEAARWSKNDTQFVDAAIKQCHELARKTGRPVYLLTHRKQIAFTAQPDKQ